jgi:hypothetical protein
MTILLGVWQKHTGQVGAYYCAVARNPSVRRSAQDDDFVGSLAKNTLDRLALIIASQYDKLWHAIHRCGAPLRMTILWECDEKHPK